MTEHTDLSSVHPVRVRMVSHGAAEGLEQAINAVLDEEQANGADVVDIKFTSTSPFEVSTLSVSHGEYAALILLRSGHARMSSP